MWNVKCFMNKFHSRCGRWIPEEVSNPLFLVQAQSECETVLHPGTTSKGLADPGGT